MSGLWNRPKPSESRRPGIAPESGKVPGNCLARSRSCRSRHPWRRWSRLPSPRHDAPALVRHAPLNRSTRFLRRPGDARSPDSRHIPTHRAMLAMVEPSCCQTWSCRPRRRPRMPIPWRAAIADLWYDDLTGGYTAPGSEPMGWPRAGRLRGVRWLPCSGAALCKSRQPSCGLHPRRRGNPQPTQPSNSPVREIPASSHCCVMSRARRGRPRRIQPR